MSAAASPRPAPILEVRDLVKHFTIGGKGMFARASGRVHALNGVSFDISPGETLALVGESGCGKTTAARVIARLYHPDSGHVRFKGRDLAMLKGKKLKAARRALQMVFQDPYGSLDPRQPISAIIGEPLKIHGIGTAAERRERVAGMMVQVGLNPRDADRYPHQFSGGQRQRIAIARALVLGPELIIADEPLSALDVSIQSQILNLLKDIQEDHGLAFLFITHDLAVVDYFADRVAVMYLGHIVEIAPRAEFFAAPRHPYSLALIDAIPVPGGGKRRLGTATAGDVPNPTAPPSGCPFHPRCTRATAACRETMPALAAVAGPGDRTHKVACHHPLEDGPLEDGPLEDGAGPAAGGPRP